MSRSLKIILIIGSVALVAAACNKPAAVSPTPAPSPTPVSTTDLKLADGRLQIDSPKEGEVLSNTFTISGYAEGWFEGTVPIKVVDSKNVVLYDRSVTVSDQDTQPRSFTKNVILDKSPATADGMIIINDYSEKDGTITYHKEINIKFTSPVSTADWKIYTNTKYGFSFKYPADMAVTTATPSARFGKGQSFTAAVPNDKWTYNVDVMANSSNQTLQQVFDANVNTWKQSAGQEFRLSDFFTSDITVGGVAAKELFINNFGDGGSTMVSLVHNGYIYMLAGGEKQGDLDPFLANFKFTGSTVQTPPAESGISGTMTVTVCGGAAPIDGGSNCRDQVGAAYTDIKDSAGVYQYFTTNSDGTFKIALKPGTYTMHAASSSNYVDVTVVAGKYTVINPHFNILAP